LNSLKKDEFLVSDYKTPSGKIHVGALRGVFIHDAVYKALVGEGKKAEFIYGFDDFDPMKSLPVYLDKEKYEPEMGKPLSSVPSPEKGYESFAEYYAKDFIEVFEKCGAKPKILWLNEEYKSGKFDTVIKELLENADAIRKIYKKVSGSIKEKNWLPISMVCEKCGKIGTTHAYLFENDKVHYECREGYVKWAKGCGYKGKASPYKGGAKLPWKVEWAAKWKVYGTDIEGAGKDHSTVGGARDIARAIAIKVLKIKEPCNIPYEWFLVEGKKMSTSKGVGAMAREMLDILPPEVLRFLILRTPPGRAINFKAEGEAIPQLFDEYDKENPGAVLSFRKVVFGLQMPKIDILGLAEIEKGDKPTKTEKGDLKKRAHYAKIWLKRFAPERYVFKVLPKITQEAKKLTAAQKEFLAEIKKIIERENKITGDELHSEIHNLKIQMRIDPREAFSAIYLIFLGKDSGPQAGWFLASLDKDFVIKRISEAIK
jgi:lysyl-tRNA synthetase class 1